MAIRCLLSSALKISLHLHPWPSWCMGQGAWQTIGVHLGLIRLDWVMDWGAMGMMMSSKMLEVSGVSQHCQKGIIGHNTHALCCCQEQVFWPNQSANRLGSIEIRSHKWYQGKALKEGCHEREWAWMSVSAREKTNAKRNLVRVMTKSKSKMQTVTDGCISWTGNESSCWWVSQCQRPHWVSRIEA